MDLISASREATYSSIQTSQHIHHLPHASARYACKYACFHANNRGPFLRMGRVQTFCSVRLLSYLAYNTNIARLDLAPSCYNPIA